MRILFVEFHRTFRQAASWLLEQRSELEVVAQAGSVAEGREKMAEGAIDAANVDIPLPDEGAEEIVRELHEANPSIPVLVMTAIEEHEVLQRMLEAGASEVLDKRGWSHLREPYLSPPPLDGMGETFSRKSRLGQYPPTL